MFEKYDLTTKTACYEALLDLGSKMQRSGHSMPAVTGLFYDMWELCHGMKPDPLVVITNDSALPEIERSEPAPLVLVTNACALPDEADFPLPAG